MIFNNLCLILSLGTSVLLTIARGIYLIGGHFFIVNMDLTSDQLFLSLLAG